MVRMVNTPAGGELMYLSGLGEALTSKKCCNGKYCGGMNILVRREDVGL